MHSRTPMIAIFRIAAIHSNFSN